MACGGCHKARQAALGALQALGEGDGARLATELRTLDATARDDFSARPIKQAVTRGVAGALARLGSMRR